MTGIIWFVQLVHYPLLARVPAKSLAACHRLHLRQTTWIVAPLMLLEAGTALFLLWRAPADAMWQAGALLLGVIWASTFLLQVRQHDALRRGQAPERAAASLIRTNWIRTIAWSGRTILLLLSVDLGVR